MGSIDNKLINFKNEIDSGLKQIKDDFIDIDSNVEKPEYAFLYWILLNLYSVDEELVLDSITEYNDKNIDCFVNFEDNKELYIIQGKYYAIDGTVSRKEVSDFVTTPIRILKEGSYKRSPELQRIFKKASKDPEYKIYFQFYSTSVKVSDDILKSVKEANNLGDSDIKASVHYDYFSLVDIYELFYGESYLNTKNMSFNLEVLNKSSFASLRNDYNIRNLRCETYYIIAPVIQAYLMRDEARKKGYKLFDQNIRDYLGANDVNSGIMQTLKGQEKNNFLFYNNGITIVCKSLTDSGQSVGKRILKLENPQVVNGCQTVNSIYSVLKDKDDNLSDWDDAFVMLKVLVIPELNDENKQFYTDVVKYTNRQNALPEKALLLDDNFFLFERLQKEFQKRGLFLKVKQSDKYRFNNEFKEVKRKEMMKTAKKYASIVGYDINRSSDIFVDLEKMLQVMVTYIKDGYYGYNKKSSILKRNSAIFKDISLCIPDYMSFDNMVCLYFLYKRTEKERKSSEDKKTPISYYVISFLSSHILAEKSSFTINKQLDKLFKLDINQFNQIYDYLKNLTSAYRRESGQEYNVMIKKKIDTEILDRVKQNYRLYNSDIMNLVDNILKIAETRDDSSGAEQLDSTDKK